MNLNQFIFITLILVLCFQCTIQKRLYRPGYSIEFRKHNQLKENEGLIKTNVSKEEIVVADQSQLSSSDSIEKNSGNQIESQNLNNEIAEQKPINLIQNTVKFIIPLFKCEKSSTIKLLKTELFQQKLHKDSSKEKHEKRIKILLFAFLILMASSIIAIVDLVGLNFFSSGFSGVFYLTLILCVLTISCLILLIHNVLAAKKGLESSEPTEPVIVEPQTIEQLKEAENKKIRSRKIKIGMLLLICTLLSIFIFGAS